ncbi:MAG: hypothetical protein ACLP8S_16360 [Solirubrobacteraceae bacterium]
MARSDDLAIRVETHASDDARDVEDADGVNRRHALLAGAPPLGKHDTRKAMAATQCLTGAVGASSGVLTRRSGQAHSSVAAV